MSISLIRILNNILSLLWCTTAFLLLLCTTPCFPGVHQQQIFLLVHHFLLPRSAPTAVFLSGAPFSPVFSFFECTTAFLLLLCTTPCFLGVHQRRFLFAVHHHQAKQGKETVFHVFTLGASMLGWHIVPTGFVPCPGRGRSLFPSL